MLSEHPGIRALQVAHNDAIRRTAPIPDLVAAVRELELARCTRSMLRVMDAIVAREGVAP